MPLNYSKWDALELSDDSDIEEHPNVDKRSMIRWKQRDIHEKREARKHRIAQLKAEIACNDVLNPRLAEFTSTLEKAESAERTGKINETVERLKKSPSPDKPPTNAPNQPTYDEMVLSLLLRVSDDAKAQVKDKEDKDAIGEKLVELLKEHLVKLREVTDKYRVELENEEKEQKKHITSDDIHDGFSSTKIAPKAEAPKPVPRQKIKQSETTYEVLNPQASLAKTSTPAEPEPEYQLGDDELPEMTPTLIKFSKIPVGDYEASWEFIQYNKGVIVPGASDALLVTAFRSQKEGRYAYAKKCVNQSLLVQYCEKLGPDGVRMFFKKMISGEKRALQVFEDDVEKTYKHLVERELAARQEEETPREQIQLVPQDPTTVIHFNVPDGPPPENLILEGPGTENLDVEEVRKMLQFRWDVFSGFSPALQEALKSGELDKVNGVLGEMDVPAAEAVVEQLNMAGIMSFVEGGIRDETGKEQEA